TDDSPLAFERVVDRLLASPLYGERWARHWMDLVHYAETHGHDQDRPRPNAWPYRDYLIRSFNNDKPYARFVQEQLAGDVLFPDDPEGVVALGLLATGPWDESSLMAIQEDTIDKKIARYLDRDDIVTTAMSTFVSATVHCARCHDHKFDPITQTDYYRLQAVFAGVDKAERPYDASPETARTRRALTAELARLDTLKAEPSPELLTAEAQAEADRYAADVASAASAWIALEPATLTSASGATLTKQPDLSVLSTGTRPEVDTCTMTAVVSLKRITALRLEVLTDDSLAHKGPGRQDNGNLHLSEVKVSAAPAAAPNDLKPVAIAIATADFNQDGWTIAHALDGNIKSAWGIYPQVGKPHQAVFVLKEPLEFADGAALSLVLEQQHGGGHLIGRFRWSATSAENPQTDAQAIPGEVAAAIAVPPAERTNRQRADLAWHARRARLERDLAKLPAQQMVYAAAFDFKPEGNFRPAGTPRPIHLLKRGDVNQSGDEVSPGALACLTALPAEFSGEAMKTEGARRAALARWTSDPQNILTWRSIANRIWQHHFGRGIVDTPNDFGRMGSLPTNPELLDWLAVTLRDNGGSLKALHRVIVLSATYRQSSAHRADFAEVDGDNRYLWRQNRTRLDAEAVRDAILQATGKLDLTMGGPSVKQFIQTPGIHVTPMVDYINFDVDRPESYRRSVYRFIFRTLPDPFMESFDCADASQLTPARNVSVTALQALAMLNNRFVVRQSEHLADRITQRTADPAAQINALYEYVLQRPPREEERTALQTYAAKHGLANACRVLLNSNEFLFVD
ncbi:MAG TPA: DUF1549 and DUF1553 domain-containing protein, partial [Planctomycetaceae bacterium]|nr:DUF1549 and DUF1553 domain-containing protein [Planctomycetaceae bacterium]